MDGARPKGDTYYSDHARKYLEERLKQPYWPVEQDSVKALLACVPDGSSVLDVPFGTGRFLAHYLEKGMQVRGLDISTEMLEVAREYWGNKFSSCSVDIGSAVAMPYEDRSFDVVVSFRFLQSIITFADVRKVLKEVARVTRRYAILQIRIRDGGVPKKVEPSDGEIMGNKMYFHDVLNLLSDSGLYVTKVISNDTRRDQSEQFVFLCESRNR
jgi:SAM-dependent methyltransferase